MSKEGGESATKRNGTYNVGQALFVGLGAGPFVLLERGYLHWRSTRESDVTGEGGTEEGGTGEGGAGGGGEGTEEGGLSN